MMIMLIANFVVNVGLPLQRLDLNMMWCWVLSYGGKQLSIWRPCWRFTWRGSREWRY